MERFFRRCFIAQGIDNEHLSPTQSHGQTGQALIVTRVGIRAEQSIHNAISGADPVAAEGAPAKTIEKPFLEPCSPNRQALARGSAGGAVEQGFLAHIVSQCGG
jgi:hypothetical protein